jgi:hypothetical protein
MSPTRDPGKWQELLEELVDTHKKIRLLLGRKNKSKKWAVWILQGASLVSSREAIEDEALGRERSLVTNIRYAIEIVDLISYFNRKTTPRSEAVRWFDGEMWTARPLRNKKAREKEERDAQAYRLSYKYNWARLPFLNQVTSAFLHPSYSSVRNSFLYGTHTHTSYIYDISAREMLDISHSFPDLYLGLSARALINGKDVLRYPSEHVTRLEEILEGLPKLRVAP